MKNNVYLLIATLLITLSGCDKEIEESTVETKSNLEINIPIYAVISEDTKSEKSTFEIDYSFSGSNTYSSKNSNNVGNEVLNAENIKIENGTMLTIPGVANGNEIYSLILEWGYKSSTEDLFIMREQLDLLSFESIVNDEIYEVELENALSDLISEINNNREYSFQIKISGKTNFDINCITKLQIPITIESKVFPFRL